MPDPQCPGPCLRAVRTGSCSFPSHGLFEHIRHLGGLPHCQPPRDGLVSSQQSSLSSHTVSREFFSYPSSYSNPRAVQDNSTVRTDGLHVAGKETKVTVIQNDLPVVKGLLKGTIGGLPVPECWNACISSVLQCTLAVVISHSIPTHPHTLSFTRMGLVKVRFIVCSSAL